jgi:hypothetical protein
MVDRDPAALQERLASVDYAIEIVVRMEKGI